METTDFRESMLKRIKTLEFDLIAARAALIAYDKAINNQYNSLTTEPIIESTSATSNQIIKNGTWLENILLVIKEKNRFVHNSEIAVTLFPYYPDKTEDEVKRRISAVISSALSKNKIEGLANYKFSKSIKDTVWGKKEWLDENGKIKAEYNFISKKNALKQSKIDF